MARVFEIKLRSFNVTGQNRGDCSAIPTVLMIILSDVVVDLVLAQEVGYDDKEIKKEPWEHLERKFRARLLHKKSAI